MAQKISQLGFALDLDYIVDESIEFSLVSDDLVVSTATVTTEIDLPGDGTATFVVTDVTDGVSIVPPPLPVGRYPYWIRVDGRTIPAGVIRVFRPGTTGISTPNGLTYSLDADGSIVNIIISNAGGGGIQSIVAGSNIVVDDTDPLNPIVSSTGGGGGGGANWGEIGGTLSSQTDLQNALNAKANTSALGTAAAANTGDFDPAGAASSAAAGAVSTANAYTDSEIGALDLGGIDSIGEGTNITIDDSDPRNPVISASGGGGGGAVDSVNGQTGAVSLDYEDVGAEQAGAVAALAGTLADVATSGAYSDLDGLPVLGSAAEEDAAAFDPAGAAAAALSSASSYTDGEIGSLQLGVVDTITGGTNVTVNDTDPRNVIISASGGGGGGGQVDSVAAGDGIDVDATDPENPEVSLDSATVASLALADSAAQSGDLAAVAFSGAYGDLDGLPTLGTAAGADVDDFAEAQHTHEVGEILNPSNGSGLVGWTGGAVEGSPAQRIAAAQTAAANTIAWRVAGGRLAVGSPVDDGEAASKGYVDIAISGRATTAQGSLADTAVQPGDLADVATSGAYSDLSGTPTLGTAAAQNTSAFDAAGSAAAALSAANGYTDSEIGAIQPAVVEVRETDPWPPAVEIPGVYYVRTEG